MSQHENLARTATDPAASLPATLRLGAVHLTVTDLDRSVVFYEDAIGLRLHRREDGVAAMGVGEEDLIVLYEKPRARRAGRHAGLYHYALLFPPARGLRMRRCVWPRPRPRSRAPPTTALTRPSICPTPTGTGSNSPLTARARIGRTSPTPAGTVGPRRWTWTACWRPSRAGAATRGRAGARDRPRAPARRRPGPRAGLLPRRARLRCHDVLPRRGRLRLSGWLPPPRL